MEVSKDSSYFWMNGKLLTARGSPILALQKQEEPLTLAYLLIA
jgi:hypothetical protein